MGNIWSKRATLFEFLGLFMGMAEPKPADPVGTALVGVRNGKGQSPEFLVECRATAMIRHKENDAIPRRRRMAPYQATEHIDNQTPPRWGGVRTLGRARAWSNYL
jgi:hypothetical protein